MEWRGLLGVRMISNYGRNEAKEIKGERIETAEMVVHGTLANFCN